MERLKELKFTQPMLKSVHYKGKLRSVDVMKHSDGVIGDHPKVHKYLLKHEGREKIIYIDEIADAIGRVKEAYLAYAFISGVNQAEYGKLMEALSAK
eukprot:14994659-Ditylum_brightwellii.AAC.1